jgi:hypothetical protein
MAEGCGDEGLPAGRDRAVGDSLGIVPEPAHLHRLLAAVDHLQPRFPWLADGRGLLEDGKKGEGDDHQNRGILHCSAQE